MFSRQFYKSSSFLDAEDSSDSFRILTTIRGLDRLIVGLEEVRMKKSMKTVFSFRIQELIRGSSRSNSKLSPTSDFRPRKSRYPTNCPCVSEDVKNYE